MSKLRVTVVMGGPGGEHDVSLMSGAAVLSQLNSAKYQSIKVVINKDGLWTFGDALPACKTDDAVQRLKESSDVVFLALHGTFGEDGTLQALFDEQQIIYTGSGATASAQAMNKLVSNECYKKQGLLVPKTASYCAQDKAIDQRILDQFGLPVVIKPVHGGSSIGVSLVKAADAIDAALTAAFACDSQVMVQEYIKGREISCGILEKSGRPNALPATECTPLKSEFFDYTAKYSSGGNSEITPAPLEPEQTDAIARAAVLAHDALGCKTYSRTDMLLRGDQLYLLETNTLPGLTEVSLLPQQAQAAGVSFPELLDLIIAGARV